MSERIDHAAEARLCDERADTENSPEWATSRHHRGVLHATLALVEQQRIANLIALGGEGWENNEAIRAILITGDKLRPEIRGALGL